jgi:hypothetical protein
MDIVDNVIGNVADGKHAVTDEVSGGSAKVSDGVG